MAGARRAQATSHLSGYLAGKAGRNLVGGRGRFNALLRNVTTRYTAPALFILAILPLPVFDVAGILAGARANQLLRTFSPPAGFRSPVIS